MAVESVSIALTGSGGAGAMTAGQMLLDAASKGGFYGLMARSMGPQIRGGEAAALVRLSSVPVESPDDTFHVLVAFDWGNIARFAAEIPLGPHSIVLADPDQGDVPDVIANTGARIVQLPMKQLAGTVDGGRANMIGLGAAAVLVGMPIEPIIQVLTATLARKGADVLKASTDCINLGAETAKAVGQSFELAPPQAYTGTRWNITGNEAAGLGALRGGVRFVAAYPITPATEVLEWMAPNLDKIGGALVQVEDELASINMILGSSFGGVPSMTATSGPGLALMAESIGLGVASETPVVIVNVMRGGPSTGIPTKSEQSDLNIALYGLHGDAPHIVVAANSISDCAFTTQWAVHLAEAMQVPTIMLSDQAMGQSKAIVAKPADLAFVGKRLTATGDLTGYKRYAATPSGISPMSVPGTPGGEYTADGLEHAESGLPSSQSSDHDKQLDKRKRKLDTFDYGTHWADIEGEGNIAVITWGAITGPVREAIQRLNAKGKKAKMISLRLLAPVRPEQMAEALKGVTKLLVVEQTHEAQFYHYLRGYYDLPEHEVLARPGPLPVRPKEIEDRIAGWM